MTLVFISCDLVVVFSSDLRMKTSPYSVENKASHDFTIVNGAPLQDMEVFSFVLFFWSFWISSHSKSMACLKTPAVHVKPSINIHSRLHEQSNW